jgi:hypothetical protein
MGTLFRYIADSALNESGLGECQHCERPTIPAYKYNGLIVDLSRAANPALAAEDNVIFAACADCIHGGNLRKDDYELRQIQPIIVAFANDSESAVRNYHLIPHVPLMMQREDWPMCCGDWCEFIGNPPDYDASVRVPSEYQFWNRQPVNRAFGFDLRPESLREVCLYRCLTCPKKYFIWQPT